LNHENQLNHPYPKPILQRDERYDAARLP